MKYGYARVSTEDQNIEPQIKALTDYGCDIIRQEKISGTSLKGREELNTLLEFLRSGDELVVTKIDRLARSLKDLENIVFNLQEKKVDLSLVETRISTNSAGGKAFLSMLGVFAEFENNLRAERQAEGIAMAKANGVYQGRKPTISVDNNLIGDIFVGLVRGHKKTDIAKTHKIGRATIYRIIDDYDQLQELAISDMQEVMIKDDVEYFFAKEGPINPEKGTVSDDIDNYLKDTFWETIKLRSEDEGDLPYEKSAWRFNKGGPRAEKILS